jgi:hypothetical protein
MIKTGKPSAGPWSVPVAVDEIPEAGLHREINAPATICASVAALAAVREVQRLSAVFDIARQGERIHVVGRVSARVGQTCVVTLEPIENDIDEPVDITFAPVPAGETALAADSDGRRRRAGEEPPEPLFGGAIDLGALATEFLILGIDPYPRKTGVEFAPPIAENDGPHPFAALEALKKRSGGQP